MNKCRYFKEGNICTILNESCLLDNMPDENKCYDDYHIIPESDINSNEKSYEEMVDEIIEESGDF